MAGGGGGGKQGPLVPCPPCQSGLQGQGLTLAPTFVGTLLSDGPSVFSDFGQCPHRLRTGGSSKLPVRQLKHLQTWPSIPRDTELPLWENRWGKAGLRTPRKDALS